MSSSRFHFTITDVARCLDKSPVTLRGWERQGLIKFPREGTDRKFTCDEVITVAVEAHDLGRIKSWRLDLVITTMTQLRIIEKENKK